MHVSMNMGHVSMNMGHEHQTRNMETNLAHWQATHSTTEPPPAPTLRVTSPPPAADDEPTEMDREAARDPGTRLDDAAFASRSHDEVGTCGDAP